MKAILPDGPKNAKIVVLGEAPGAEEAKQGRPFVGTSGRMLFDDILLEGPIHRRECYVLNTCWVRPRGNKLTTVPQTVRDKYIAKTWERIYAHPRELVVAVGGTALRFMLGTEADQRLKALVGTKSASTPGAGIYKLRGSPLRGRRSPSDPWLTFIPLIHPAALVHEQGARYRDIQLCRLDAQKAARWASGTQTLPSYRILNFARLRAAQEAHGGFTGDATHRVYQSYAVALDRIAREAIAVVFDVETSHDTLSVIGLAWNSRDALVLPLTGELPIPETAILLGKVKAILENPAIAKIAQNAEFDTEWLRSYGIGIRGFYMDTLLAHGVIHPETPHSLAMLVSIYTNQPYYKDMVKGQGWDSYTETLWDYNGMDCCLTYECALKLTAEIQGIQP